jgi:UDP-4-amino-4-deoxy-L-arabinose-oxoglutarate aminotransferase
MNVPFYRHQLGHEAVEAVAKVIASPILTSGQVGKSVEADLARYFGVPHALLVNSWTNGAAACLLAMNIGPGDEVIVPAMTFIASANIVELVGAKPVFVDVDPDTLMMTPAGVARALTPRTKAVMPVHLYGQMADVAGIRSVVGLKIRIIEDSAHCFEGTRDLERPGKHSDAAIFSFYATKNVTCGEGGAIITHDDELAHNLRMTRLHGMSAGAIDRYQGGVYNHWDMPRLGMKANLPDVLAALLPAQIPLIEGKRQKRERLAARYTQAFSRRNDIVLQEIIPSCVHAWHLFVVRVDEACRDPLLLALGKAGIGCAVNFRSVPTMSYYRGRYHFTERDFPISEAWGRGAISLPLYPDLDEAEQDYVIDTVTSRLSDLTSNHITAL